MTASTSRRLRTLLLLACSSAAVPACQVYEGEGTTHDKLVAVRAVEPARAATALHTVGTPGHRFAARCRAGSSRASAADGAAA